VIGFNSQRPSICPTEEVTREKTAYPHMASFQDAFVQQERHLQALA
jgi:hypothetical protein